MAPPLDSSSPLSRRRVEDAAVGLSADHRESAAGTASLTADGLCETYAARVYKFAQLISADSSSAEALAQDALERAIRGLNTFDPAKGEVEGWLWRIVVNAGRDANTMTSVQRLVFELLAGRRSLDEKTR